MSDPRTDLPAPGAPNFNQRLREVIQTYLGRQGNPLDRGLTLRDLVDTGVLKLRTGFQLKPGTGSSVPLEPGDGVVGTYEPDLTPPPTPGSMTVTASISHVMIEHEVPIYRQGHGHLRTRVYGKIVNAGDPLPTFADAAEIGQFSGAVYAQPSNPATTWRLWIKWETNDGVLSADPAGGINGLEAITGQDVGFLLQALSGKITSSQLYADLNARINLIDAPATIQGSVAQRLSAEATARADAILSEAQARGTADQALQSQINMLSAAGSGDFTELLAAVQEEQTARIAGDAAEATSRETLAARVTSNEGTLTSQASQINDRYTKVETDSAISSSSQALSAAYQAADASTLTSAKAHADAGILSEQTTRANADSALASSITTLGATVNNNNTTLSAAIQGEATARANADTAVARSVSTLQASAGTGGLVYNGSFANGSAEGWAGLAGVSSTPYGGLPKAYAGIQTTRDINFPNTDASQWMACKPGDEFEVSAWVSAEHASPMYSIGVQYEKTDGRIDNWVPIASTEGPTTAKFLRGYWTAPNDARRLRFWGQVNIPNDATASAWGITDAQLRRTDARTGANTAAIQVEAETRAEQTGELYAKYGIKLDVNGYVTGWAMNNDGTTGDMIVLADRFAVGAPGGGDIIPFVVNTTEQTINGVKVPAGTYMDAAYVKNGTITNAKIANLAVDDAKIASLSATKLTAGQLQVGSWIASSNYVAGAQGWAINSDGTAELSNAVVRGTVYATSGEFSGTVKAGATILGGLAASYSSGAGFYGGLESGAYKWRVGSPTGARIQWTGAAIEVYDASNKLTISSGGVDWGSVTGQGRPADGATVGAPAGTYVGDKLAESLVADVLGAVSAASNASSDATAALDLISDISSDSKFTPIERLAARKEWDEIAGEWFGIYASGGNFGLTALQEAYQAATRALGSYLNGAPWISFDVIPAGISEAYLNATTEINSTEFRSKFKDYYTARQALLNAVADVAATRATWPSVTGEGRPADGATVGATFGVNISGQITPSNASTYIANAAIGTAHIADAAINSAKIGSASIMTANIGEAQVNTLQIAGNAVTVPEVATGDSTIAGNGEYQYILGTQITISEPGMVMASFAAKQDFPNGGRRWDVKLYIDGVERFYTYGGIANDSISMAGALYISTAKTVNISVYWKGADEYCYVKNRCLWAMGAKR